jgi:DNA-binding NtrC family response regulator
VESILFGHEKGAFTGATERHAGKFLEANGGTLFLDEISELPLTAQVKLLRALQQGEVEAVGGRKPVKVDVRIVSATNRNLLNQVKAGQFREDLFYRLHVLPLTIPPLRTRREDIPLLVRHFMARIAAEEGRQVTSVSGEAMALLGQLPWPGNVRQLENAVYRAVVMSDGGQLGPNDFPLSGGMASILATEAEPVVLDSPPRLQQSRYRVSKYLSRHRPSPAARYRLTAHWPWSMTAAKCVRLKQWKPKSSVSPSRITAGRCPRWHAG